MALLRRGYGGQPPSSLRSAKAGGGGGIDCRWQVRSTRVSRDLSLATHPLRVCHAASRRFANLLRNLAVGEGFEPPEPCGSAVFKTAAIDHSATPPRVPPKVAQERHRSTTGVRAVDRGLWVEDSGRTAVRLDESCNPLAGARSHGGRGYISPQSDVRADWGQSAPPQARRRILCGRRSGICRDGGRGIRRGEDDCWPSTRQSRCPRRSAASPSAKSSSRRE